MKNQKMDLRIRYTKTILKDSLLELMKEKSFEKITIKELCDKANINRGTFYYHYDTIEELLKDIETEFISNHTHILESYWDNNRDINIMGSLFSCIQENQELCKVLIGPHGDPSFIASLLEPVSQQVIIGWEKEFPDISRHHLSILSKFVFAGAMALLQDWICNGSNISPEELSHYLEILGHYSLLAASSFPQEK